MIEKAMEWSVVIIVGFFELVIIVAFAGALLFWAGRLSNILV